MMEKELTTDVEEERTTPLDEEGAITVIGHLLIIDKETGEELVNKRA